MTSLSVSYAQIPKKDVHWLHDGFVPFRHVTVVVGQGGTSKGICTLDYAARMTRGDPMPGELESSCAGPMDVVVVLPEDDANESVRGRLDGAGAALDRVHNLTVLPDGHSFAVPGDVALIGPAIDEIEDPEQTPLPADGKPRTVGMVILDPLLALAENDLRTRGQARPVMEALEQVARDRHLVIFLTHHTNADGKAASSRAITETARNVITLSRVPKAPEDDPVRVLTVSKTNIGRTGIAARYTLTGPLDEPHVVWACELPPEQASRGYDTEQTVEQSASPAAAGCKHPWKAGSCSDCPLRVKGTAVPAARTARPPFAGIPLSQRYRASWMDGDGKPQVIDDFESRVQARGACVIQAKTSLSWQQTTVKGMEGAVVGTARYAVLDRYAQQASPDSKAA